MKTQERQPQVHPSVELCISHKTLLCDDITQYLMQTGILASIIPNKSVICDTNQNNKNPDSQLKSNSKVPTNTCHVENGCKILFGSASKSTIKTTWENLKQEHNLTCAHIKIPHLFSGCIYDYLADSKCPAEKACMETCPQ